MGGLPRLRASLLNLCLSLLSLSSLRDRKGGWTPRPLFSPQNNPICPLTSGLRKFALDSERTSLFSP